MWPDDETLARGIDDTDSVTGGGSTDDDSNEQVDS